MDNGRIVALFPGFTKEYMQAVKKPKLADYQMA